MECETESAFTVASAQSLPPFNVLTTKGKVLQPQKTLLTPANKSNEVVKDGCTIKPVTRLKRVMIVKKNSTITISSEPGNLSIRPNSANGRKTTINEKMPGIKKRKPNNLNWDEKAEIDHKGVVNETGRRKSNLNNKRTREVWLRTNVNEAKLNENFTNDSSNNHKPCNEITDNDVVMDSSNTVNLTFSKKNKTVDQKTQTDIYSWLIKEKSRDLYMCLDGIINCESTLERIALREWKNVGNVENKGIQTDSPSLGSKLNEKSGKENKLIETSTRNVYRNPGPNMINNEDFIGDFLSSVYNDIKTCLKEDRFGNIPLHQAVLDNDLKGLKCQCVVMKGLNLKEHINDSNENGETALMLATKRAVETGRSEAVQYLIDEGADQAIADYNGCFPLHFAVQHGDSQLTALLLSANGVDTVVNRACRGFSPLHLAAIRGYMDIIEQLLDMNADINIKDRMCGRTPFYLAVENKLAKVAKLLTSRGADVSEPNFAGQVAPELLREKLDSANESKPTNAGIGDPGNESYGNQIDESRCRDSNNHKAINNIEQPGKIIMKSRREVKNRSKNKKLKQLAQRTSTQAISNVGQGKEQKSDSANTANQYNGTSKANTQEQTSDSANTAKQYNGTSKANSLEQTSDSANTAKQYNGTSKANSREQTSDSANTAKHYNGTITANSREQTYDSANTAKQYNGTSKANSREQTSDSANTAKQYNGTIKANSREQKSDSANTAKHYNGTGKTNSREQKSDSANTAKQYNGTEANSRGALTYYFRTEEGKVIHLNGRSLLHNARLLQNTASDSIHLKSPEKIGSYCCKKRANIFKETDILKAMNMENPKTKSPSVESEVPEASYHTEISHPILQGISSEPDDLRARMNDSQSSNAISIIDNKKCLVVGVNNSENRTGFIKSKYNKILEGSSPKRKTCSQEDNTTVNDFKNIVKKRGVSSGGTSNDHTQEKSRLLKNKNKKQILEVHADHDTCHEHVPLDELGKMSHVDNESFNPASNNLLCEKRPQYAISSNGNCTDSKEEERIYLIL